MPTITNLEGRLYSVPPRSGQPLSADRPDLRLFRPALLLAIFFCNSWLAHAQYQPPPPPLTTAPCIPTKKDPCLQPSSAPASPTPSSADRFPFPGEESSKPASSSDPTTTNPTTQPASSSKPGPSTPDTPPTTPASAAQAFPFPGEPADAPGNSSSSSSSSSSSDSDSDPAEIPSKSPLKDEGSSGSTRASRRHLPKVEDLDQREAKDIEVANFYIATRNFIGAYARAKDAIRLAPDDSEAHLALAQSAQSLNKKDEAIAEYTLYLKLDPDGDKAKLAHRELSTLAPK